MGNHLPTNGHHHGSLTRKNNGNNINNSKQSPRPPELKKGSDNSSTSCENPEVYVHSPHPLPASPSPSTGRRTGDTPAKTMLNILFNKTGSSFRQPAELIHSKESDTTISSVDSSVVPGQNNNSSHQPLNIQRQSSMKRSTVSSQTSNFSNESCSVSECEKLRHELRDAKHQLYEREQSLQKLNREIHKLRSVIDSSDINTLMKPSLSMELLLSNENIDKLAVYPNKKQGVSGESYGSIAALPMQNVNFVWKDFDARQQIKGALMDNSFLKDYLNPEQLELIVDSMYEKEFAKSSHICRRGTYGSHLFVINTGHCEVIDAVGPCNRIGPGKAFGELAILYNCNRTASIKALTKVRVWVLDRKVFQLIMMKTGLDRSQNIKQFLQNVPLLKNLGSDKIAKICDVVEVDYYPSGHYICRQGEYGDSFYIVSKGSVRVTRSSMGLSSTASSSPSHEQLIRTLSTGDTFGEQALLACLNQVDYIPHSLQSVRTANVVSEDCECLVLDQHHFLTLLSELQEIRIKTYTDIEDKIPTPLRSPKTPTATERKNEIPKSPTKKTSPGTLDPFINQLKLTDLQEVCKLGMGGFGLVTLVRTEKEPNRIFALKRCTKYFIRRARQEQHIINEKLVMQRISGRHQFIIQLYRTFKDDKCVYFLMETALGGELWTVLRQRGPFSEVASRFYVGCVIEALQFLHSNNIIYRDLKPENCLLDRDGYLKLTDFGFSKFVQPGDKTWTFCGTPEYVAPEIILNRGHDRSVDIWAIGILLYELLTGIPPFMAPDPLQTYHIILRGFDSIGFDENIFSKHCVSLIRALSRENPVDRLGMRGRNGFLEIKRHKWFSGFNWNSLIARKLTPPIVPQLESNIDTKYFDIIRGSIDHTQHAERLSPNPNSKKPGSPNKLSISPPATVSKASSNEHLSPGSVTPCNDSGNESSPLHEFTLDWEIYF